MSGSILFFIILIVVLRGISERSRSGSGSRKSVGGADSVTGKRIDQSRRSPLAEKGVERARPAQPVRKSSAAVFTAAKEENDAAADGQISTTEYLRQKAQEDQREHEEEARREAMRLHRETGGRRAAQRHYDGDSIPQGMRLVKCSYCGAENLIGNYEKQENYTCYFCREIL